MMRFLALLFLCLPVCAAAHEAPSGWAYPKDCCDGTDCEQVPCASIERTGEQSWRHAAANFMANNLRQPRDNRCHVCKWGSIGRCIFFPIPPSS